MKTGIPNGSKGTHSARMVGVILAGGMSTRMGSSKADLPFRGARLIDHMASLLRSVRPCKGADHVHISVSGQVAGYECISDLELGQGPLGGLQAVLSHFPDAVVLFVPVDMPALQTRDLDFLVESLGSGNAVFYEGCYLPAVIRSNAEVLACLSSLLNSSVPFRERSVRTLLDRLSATVLAVSASDRSRFRNTNTPEEWETWVQESVS